MMTFGWGDGAIVAYYAQRPMVRVHSTEELHAHEPLIGFAGTGSAGESGQHLARAQTAILTELTAYQANVAEVCKRVHQCIDAYTIATGESIKVTYVPESDGEKRSKAEVRELTPKMAKLPIDVTYTIGSRTPEGDWAAEQMSRTRWLDGVYGLTEHQKQIGITDPIRTQFETGVDSMLGSVKGLLEGEISPLLKEYIRQETLSRALTQGRAEGGYAEELTVDGHTVRLTVRKV